MTVPLRLGPAALAALHDGSLDAADAARLSEALRVRPGQRSWSARAARAECAVLIRGLARLYSGSRNHQAEAICRDLRGYESSTWLRTRADLECRHRDERRQLFWRILKTRGRAPSVRLINDILASRS